MNFTNFEAATTSLNDSKKRAEAEAYLKALRLENDVYRFYLSVLEMKNVPVQQFHAASGLGIWAMENYSIDTVKLLKDIRSSLVQLLSDDMVHFVREELAQVVALITKRSWMDEAEHDKLEFLSLVYSLLEGTEHLKFNGLVIISALCNEFSSDKASSVGLPREFHLYTRQIFQDKLFDIFTRIIGLMHGIIQSYREEQKILLKLCFSTVEKFISWDFVNDVTIPKHLLNTSDDDVSSWSVGLPKEWTDQIAREEILQLFLKGHSLLGADRDKSRQCFIQLACISGDSFQENSSFLPGFVQILLGLINQFLLTSINRDSTDEHELLAITQITTRLFNNHHLEKFGAIPDFTKLLEELGKTSLFVTSLCTTDDDDPFIESLDDILDVWAGLIQDMELLDSQKRSMNEGFQFSMPNLLALITNISSALWSDYVNFILRFSEANAYKDEDDQHGFKDQDMYLESLTNSAIIGRMNPHASVGKLLELLSPRAELLDQILSAGTLDARLPVLFEQIHWIIMLSGHFLADPPIGETPLIPMSILKYSKSQGGFMEDPIVVLCKVVFHFLEILKVEPGTPKFDICSPALVETLFWFIKRWSRTYLIVDTADYPFISQSIIQTFGYPGEGPQVLDYLIEMIHKNLAAWASEADIVMQLIMCLKCFSLSPLIRRQMLASAKFNHLVTFFLNNLSRMPPNIQSILIETIANIATHAEPAELRNTYFSSLSNAIDLQLSSLIGRPDFNSIYTEQNFMEKIVAILEMYDGLSMAADESNSGPIFEACAKHFSTLIKLLDLYHNFQEFEIYVLRIFAHLASYMSFEVLTQDQKMVFYSSISQLLAVYTKNETHRKRVKITHDEEELFEDLSFILQILTSLITGEFEGLGISLQLIIEKSQIMTQRQVKVGDSNLYQLMFYSISLIIPLITDQMLEVSFLFS